MNRVLRGMYGPKKDEGMEGWKKQRNEETRNLHPSPNIVKEIKSRSMT
jgi:hypothetical protein